MVAPLFIFGVFRFAGPLYALVLIATTMLMTVARYLDEAPILAAKPSLQTDRAVDRCGSARSYAGNWVMTA